MLKNKKLKLFANAAFFIGFIKFIYKNVKLKHFKNSKFYSHYIEHKN